LLKEAKRQTIIRIFNLPHLPGRSGRFSSLAQSRASQLEKESIMSKKPSHYAHVVSTPKKQGEKAYWTRVGSVFQHQSGKGFDIVLAEGIAVNGRIVCTEPKGTEEQDTGQ